MAGESSKLDVAEGADVPPVSLEGVLVAGSVQLACLGCGEMIVANFVNEAWQEAGPEDFVVEDVGCPKCSQAHGRPAAITVALLVGRQVLEVLEPAEDEPEAPGGAGELAVVGGAAAPPAEDKES